MSPRATRVLASVHRWLGLALCLPLAAVAISGSLLLFRNALWVPADWRTTTIDIARADAALAGALAGDDRWTYVDIASPGRAFHTIGQAEGPLAVLEVGANAGAEAPSRLAVEHALFALHTRLLAGDAGKTLIQVMGPLAVASLLLGVWLWWPRRHGWRRRDLVRLSATRPSMLRWHQGWGAVVFVTLLPLVLSGALLAHNPAIRAWLKPLSPPVAPVPVAVAELRFEPGDLGAALVAARRAWPDGRLTQLSRSAPGADVLTLKFRLPGEWHPNGRSLLTADLSAGRIVGLRDARRGGLPAAYDDFLYAFHIADLGGMAQAWLWLASGLVLSGLVATGVLAWFKGRRRGT